MCVAVLERKLLLAFKIFLIEEIRGILCSTATLCLVLHAHRRD